MLLQETIPAVSPPAAQLTKAQRLNVSSWYYGAWLVMLFAVFLGSPGMAFYIALPWIAIAIVARFPGDFILFRDGTLDSRLPLLLCWFFSLWNLGGPPDVKFVGDWTSPIWMACIPATLLFLSLIAADRLLSGRAESALLLPALLSCIYGYGVVLQLNVMLDRSPATTVQSKVVDMIYGAKSGHIVLIEHWGRVRIDQAEFWKLQRGGPVCLTLHDGAFGLSWYAAHVCR